MATRGYFTIKNQDNEHDPYIGKDDILVEAYHDGYMDYMVSNILMIPVRLAEMFTQSNNMGYLCSLIKTEKERIVYDKLLDINLNVGLIDMAWDATYDLLVATKPLMYNRIDTGVSRYGHPVDFGDSFFTIDHNVDSRAGDILKITFNEEHIDEEKLEYLTKVVESVNSFIYRDEVKITIDKDGNIEMSILKITFDVLERLVHDPKEFYLKEPRNPNPMELFDEVAQKKMKRWNIEKFSETHPTLLSSIIEAMEQYKLTTKGV